MLEWGTHESSEKRGMGYPICQPYAVLDLLCCAAGLDPAFTGSFESIEVHPAGTLDFPPIPSLAGAVPVGFGPPAGAQSQNALQSLQFWFEQQQLQALGEGSVQFGGLPGVSGITTPSVHPLQQQPQQLMPPPQQPFQQPQQRQRGLFRAETFGAPGGSLLPAVSRRRACCKRMWNSLGGRAENCWLLRRGCV